MKAAITLVTIICGTALIITQRVMDGSVQGLPSYCEVAGFGLCIAGVTMAFRFFGPGVAPGAERLTAA